MIKVFIGFDPRQPVAANVLAHSIQVNSTKPVAITFLNLKQLPITRKGLTDFTYSRFLVPWLSEYEGHSVFVDSDFVCLGDISNLIAISLLERIKEGSPETSVWVSKNKLKYEWASLMVFDNEQCKILTPEYVQDEANSLFDFAWAKRVGELPGEWNFLVGYDEAVPRILPKMIHYTQGIPVWPETKDCDYSGEWKYLSLESRSSVSFGALMGRSVHAKPVHDKLRQDLSGPKDTHCV